MTEGRKHIVVIDPDPSWISTIRLAKRREYRISAITSKRFKKAYPTVAEHIDDEIIAETTNTNKLTIALQKLHSSEPVSGILVHRDAMIHKAAKACEIVGIPFTSANGVRLARNKRLSRLRLEKHGLSNIRQAFSKSANELPFAANAIGYPCIIKPATGHASRLAFRLENDEDLSDACDEIIEWEQNAHPKDLWITSSGFVCEEWISGPIISVELSAVDSIYAPITVALATSYPENPCAGFGSIIPFCFQPVSDLCIKYASEVCRTLGLDNGAFDIEMIWHDGHPIILEANPRKMGGEMAKALRLSTGISYEAVLLNAYVERSLKIPRKSKSKISCIRKLIAEIGGTTTDEAVHKILEVMQQYSQATLFNYALHPGQGFEKWDIVGRFILECSDEKHGFEQANSIVSRLEVASGIKFVQSGRLIWPQ
ncbi:ATP-grasp domain-containing protein [Tardiphaga sp. 804_B3_N1_9]|uniref:ATP-grasp domain-containing protein n=1 Tax=Tardiphaga sp. 804_B3_N1_9 TaxID=3240786 RepID=UPI003F24680A